MVTLLSLLIAATPVAGDNAAARRPVSRLASATVTIVHAERIVVSLVEAQSPMPDRQIREREARPMVEFY